MRQDTIQRPDNEQMVVFALDADGAVSQLRLFGQDFTRVSGREPATTGR